MQRHDRRRQLQCALNSKPSGSPPHVVTWYVFIFCAILQKREEFHFCFGFECAADDLGHFGAPRATRMLYFYLNSRLSRPQTHTLFSHHTLDAIPPSLFVRYFFLFSFAISLVQPAYSWRWCTRFHTDFHFSSNKNT